MKLTFQDQVTIQLLDANNTSFFAGASLRLVNEQQGTYFDETIYSKLSPEACVTGPMKH